MALFGVRTSSLDEVFGYVLGVNSAQDKKLAVYFEIDNVLSRPGEFNARFVQFLRVANVEVYLLTARGEKDRKNTVRQLFERNILLDRCHLLMAPPALGGRSRKGEYLYRHLEDRKNIHVVVVDSQVPGVWSASLALKQKQREEKSISFMTFQYLHSERDNMDFTEFGNLPTRSYFFPPGVKKKEDSDEVPCWQWVQFDCAENIEVPKDTGATKQVTEVTCDVDYVDRTGVWLNSTTVSKVDNGGKLLSRENQAPSEG